MKLLLKAEYVALFILSVWLFSKLSYAWWYPVLFLAPDVGMIGYLLNPRVGAVTYNFTHTLALGLVIYVAGSFMQVPIVELVGVILIGHSSLDRVLGFGLKYTDSFKSTNLGNL